MKQDNSLLIIVIILLALFLLGGFGMMGFRGFGIMPMHYGISSLCSASGGIWCYWPAYTFSMIIPLLFIIILILTIVLLVRKLK